mmetsp:Transcript_18900/g.35126  ORF Transcript_18900/g.35126 Transcript_18900/m.35126 type:complete len:211 (-) Transcript_18900:87-719(-)
MIVHERSGTRVQLVVRLPQYRSGRDGHLLLHSLSSLSGLGGVVDLLALVLADHPLHCRAADGVSSLSLLLPGPGGFALHCRRRRARSPHNSQEKQRRHCCGGGRCRSAWYSHRGALRCSVPRAGRLNPRTSLNLAAATEFLSSSPPIITASHGVSTRGLCVRCESYSRQNRCGPLSLSHEPPLAALSSALPRSLVRSRCQAAGNPASCCC